MSRVRSSDGMARTGLLLACAGALMLSAAAQYPSQYPSQYPGQYPSQYPSQYPGQYPGGTGIPGIHLPRRTPKDKKDDKKETVTLRPVDGALRKLGEKDLIIETAAHRFLRFRLLAKTQFRNKAGEAIRDSLLQPGDQLSVRVNPDDAETAIQVVVERAGTAEERASAARPFNQDLVTTASAADLGKAVKVARTTPGEEPIETAPPPGEGVSGNMKNDAPAPPAGDGVSGNVRRDSPVPATTKTSAPAPVVASGGADQTIADAREAAETLTSGLPNFVVEQVTTRSIGLGPTPLWQVKDEVTAELAYVDGREEYRNIAINGRRSTQPPERSGTWSTGEFAITLQDLLSPATAAAFRRRGSERVGGRDAAVYEYAVDQANSHWVVSDDSGRNFTPGYRGRLWIDDTTHSVLRVEQKAVPPSSSFPFERVEVTVEYGFVRIDAGTYLLPAESENIACKRGGGGTRNVLKFRNYRKFSSESTIRFD